MREIEIKAKVDDFRLIEEKIKTLGFKLGQIKKQHDVVYGEPDSIEGVSGYNWLRIRTENDKVVYFTLKRSVVGHLDSIEHEVIVDNALELQFIIEYLRYELYSDLTKIRRKAKLGDIEICLDEVPNLGSFIEIEKLIDNDSELDHDEVVDELWTLLEVLGVSKSQEIHEGYDVLERRTRGL